MSIRIKATLVIISVVSFMILATSFVVRTFASRSFADIELIQTQNNIDRSKKVFESLVNGIDSKIRDWSSWDDTYAYIKNKNKEYEKSNLIPETLTSLNVDTILYFDTEFNLINEVSKDVNIGAGFVRNFNSELVNSDSGLQGWMSLDSKLYIFSMRPILRSDGSGPIGGWLVFVKLFGEDELKKARDLSGLNIEYQNKFIEKDQISIIDQDSIESNIVITDVNKKNIGTFRFISNRDIYKQGLYGLNLITNILIVIGLILIPLGYVIVSVIVLNPITNVISELEDIGYNPKQRLLENGSSEIRNLRMKINKILNFLENNQARINKYFNMIDYLVLSLDKNGKIESVNNYAAKVIGRHAEEIIGYTWFDFLDKESSLKFKQMFENIKKGELALSRTYEDKVKSTNGDIRLISWKSLIITDDQKMFSGLLISGEDVTDIRKIESERELHARQLETLNESMVGRELKMAELKKENNSLRKRLGDKL